MDYALDVTMERDREGKLSAETRIPLGYDRRELRISTSASRGEIGTLAQVVQISEPTGTGFTGFSFMMFQDYYKNVGRVKGRGTEAAIKAAHLAALKNVRSIELEARAHHPDPAAKVAA